MSLQVSTAIIVDGTLYALGAFSVATWALIFIKAVQQVRVGIANRRFKKSFWGASDLAAAAALEDKAGPAGRLGFVGFGALRETDGSVQDLEHSGDRQDVLERYLRQQLQKERHALDSGLAILASIGSTAPFVGLFGTVFGIMRALTDIGKTGSASLDVVAGPIGEALVATGIGIAVAVPAVLAYNFFVRRVKLIGADLEDFATDFVNLAQRSQFRLRKTPSAVGNRDNSSANSSGNSQGNSQGNSPGKNAPKGAEVFA